MPLSGHGRAGCCPVFTGCRYSLIQDRIVCKTNYDNQVGSAHHVRIFCCFSRPFGHGYSSLSICFHLPHMLFYPLHLVHQSPDLEVHHILRHLWE